jgi:hypothetical protein
MECENEHAYADKPAVIVPLAPVSKVQPDANIVADDSARAIVALLQKAAQTAKDDSTRAMDLMHKHFVSTSSGRGKGERS